MYFGTDCPGAYQVEAFKVLICNRSVDWGNVLQENVNSICLGQTCTAKGQVWVDGVTNSAGQGAGIEAQFGYSTTNDDPSGTGWIWNDATFNAQVGNDDEFKYDFTPSTAETYYYAFRYRTSASCTWYYAGYGGGSWNGTSSVNG